MPAPSVNPIPALDGPAELRWPFAQVFLPEDERPTLCIVTGVYPHPVKPPALRDGKGRELRRADGWPVAADGTPLPSWHYVDAIAFPRGKVPRLVAFNYEEHQPPAAPPPPADPVAPAAT